MGNDQGPKTLSFFAMDRDLTVRIYVNGSEVKDLKLAHGSSGYIQGAFFWFCCDGNCLGHVEAICCS